MVVVLVKLFGLLLGDVTLIKAVYTQKYTLVYLDYIRTKLYNFVYVFAVLFLIKSLETNKLKRIKNLQYQ